MIITCSISWDGEIGTSLSTKMKTVVAIVTG